MIDACKIEVVGLHDFFVAWFTGALEKTEANFQRFERAMDPGFEIISPQAEAASFESLKSALWQAHGFRRDDPGFRIEIRNPRARINDQALYLLVYEEWQFWDGGAGRNGRLSSALFSAKPDAPNGVVWRHLQETWLEN